MRDRKTIEKVLLCCGFRYGSKAFKLIPKVVNQLAYSKKFIEALEYAIDDTSISHTATKTAHKAIDYSLREAHASNRLYNLNKLSRMPFIQDAPPTAKEFCLFLLDLEIDDDAFTEYIM